MRNRISTYNAEGNRIWFNCPKSSATAEDIALIVDETAADVLVSLTQKDKIASVTYTSGVLYVELVDTNMDLTGHTLSVFVDYGDELPTAADVQGLAGEEMLSSAIVANAVNAAKVGGKWFVNTGRRKTGMLLYSDNGQSSRSLVATSNVNLQAGDKVYRVSSTGEIEWQTQLDVEDVLRVSLADLLNSIGTPAEGQPATLFEAIAQGGGGGGSEEIMAKLNEIETALKKADVQSSFEGYKFEDGFNSLSLLDFLRVANDKNIVEIYDDSATKISTERFSAFSANSTAKRVTFTRVIDTRLQNPIVDVFGNNNSVLEELNLPKLSLAGSYQYLRSYSALKIIRIPNLSNVYEQDTYSFADAQNLIDIEFGKAVNKNVNFLQRWSPTNALSSSSTSLVEEGEPFASNLEKLLYNIREHIAANLPSISATITFSAAVKAAILADAATASAFTSKGWTIA